MATVGISLTPITPGDDFSVDHLTLAVPNGITIVQARMGLKYRIQDATQIIEIPLKVITSTNVPGTGQIVNVGSLVNNVWTVEVRFDFPGAQTILLRPGVTYYYWIDVLTPGSAKYTSEVVGAWPMLTGGSSG